jgi:hypothetical protein
VEGVLEHLGHPGKCSVRLQQAGTGTRGGMRGLVEVVGGAIKRVYPILAQLADPRLPGPEAHAHLLAPPLEY